MKHGRLNVVIYLHVAGAKVLSPRAVHIVARYGRLDILRYQHLNGADLISDRSVLHAAVDGGQLECVKYLYANGCDILADPSLLVIAAEQGFVEVLKYFHVNGAAVTEQPRLLIAAAEHGRLEIVRYLHVNGMNVNAHQAVLTAAAKHGQLEVLKYLHVNGGSLASREHQALKSAVAAGQSEVAGYIQRALSIRHYEWKDASTPLKPLVFLYLDVFGHCNLRCPSCPVQNWPREDKAFTAGLMNETMLRRILDKAAEEINIAQLGFFNWTEPLLNPNLPSLIEVARSYGHQVLISSNLNVLPDPEALIRSEPTWMRVSVSGFTQEVYGRSHKGGDIEVVKANMRRLAEARAVTGSRTNLELFFHRYVDNEDDENLMRDYAQSLGFEFLPGWAFMLPLEKVLKYADPSSKEAVLTDVDRETMSRFAVGMDDALEVAGRNKVNQCTLQDDFLALDVKGDVFLCCASSGKAKNRLGNYLELSFEEIQRRKYAHSLCGPCFKHGLPSLPSICNVAPEEYDRLGRETRGKVRDLASV